MQRLLVLDFDDTLLDTHAHKLAMAKALGLSENEWNAAYAAFKQDNKIFEPNVFLRGVTTAERDAFYETVDHIERFLFSDSMKCITDAQADGWQVHILTAGDAEWQKRKVDGVKWPTGVTYEITPKDKALPMQRMLEQNQYDRVVFIDNKTEHTTEVKEVLPQIECLLMQRTPEAAPEGKYDRIVHELTSNIL